MRFKGILEIGAAEEGTAVLNRPGIVAGVARAAPGHEEAAFYRSCNPLGEFDFGAARFGGITVRERPAQPCGRKRERNGDVHARLVRPAEALPAFGAVDIFRQGVVRRIHK